MQYYNVRASSRLVYCATKCCHITSILQTLQNLPVRLSIDFKIRLVAFMILRGLSLSYLAYRFRIFNWVEVERVYC